MFDPGTLALLDTGFRFSAQVLSLVHQTGSGEHGNRGELQDLLAQTSERLETAIKDVAREIIDKIEADKMEELRSRIANLTLIMKLDRLDQDIRSLMALKESVDYAGNRLRENKMHWLGPFLLGHTLFLSGLSLTSNETELQIKSFEQTVMDCRIRLLEFLKPMLLEHQPAPWIEIREFLAGESTRIFDLVSGTAPRAMASGIEAIIRETLGNIDCAFFAPDIPAKKLRSARTKLLIGPTHPERVIALVDTTIFGGGAEGLAFFPTYFTYADLGDANGIMIAYDELREKEIARDGAKIKVGKAVLSTYRAAESVEKLLRRLATL